MPLDTLLDQIHELVDGLGFELVDLRRTGTRERPILQVRIDRADSAPGSGVTADDCARVSRALENSLESAGSANLKTTSVERTKSSIAGSVSRARSSTFRSLRASAATSDAYVTRAKASPSRARPPARRRVR